VKRARKRSASKPFLRPGETHSVAELLNLPDQAKTPRVQFCIAAKWPMYCDPHPPARVGTHNRSGRRLPGAVAIKVRR